MAAELERMTSPYVKKEFFVTTEKGLALTVAMGDITDECLVSALRQGLRLGRRFLLRPAPKDW